MTEGLTRWGLDDRHQSKLQDSIDASEGLVLANHYTWVLMCGRGPVPQDVYLDRERQSTYYVVQSFRETPNSSIHQTPPTKRCLGSDLPSLLV